MAGSVNRATILGHLGADPEIRRSRDGKAIANFRVATSETWRDKNSGERKEKSEWHSIVIFNEGLASVAEKYLRKGSKVLVEGQLQTRKWQDQSGNDRYSTEVVLNGFDAKLILLDGRDSGGRRDDRDDDRRSRSDDYRGGDSRSDRQRTSQRNDYDDQDIPF